MKKVLVVCGPTAIGKTSMAAILAKKFNGELISADSRQVYRGMNLTTGKDYPDVPIYLLDEVNPDEDFSVNHWAGRANAVIDDIDARKKLPIVVGGTGLYISALLKPLETIHIPPDKVLRDRVKNMSLKALQSLIMRGSMNDSDWNNPRRLIRKIEITRSKISNRVTQKKYSALVIGLTAPLPILDRRIDERLKVRIKKGLHAEIAALRMKYDANLPSMSALELNEHAYARRQLTWFKKQPGIHWFDVSTGGFQKGVEELVQAWYTH